MDRCPPLAFILVTLLWLSACDSGTGTDDASTNSAPSIHVAPVETAAATATVIVEASDPEDDPLSYAMEQRDGPATAVITSATSDPGRITIQVPLSGTYTFVCRVSDGTLQAETLTTLTVTETNSFSLALSGTRGGAAATGEPLRLVWLPHAQTLRTDVSDAAGSGRFAGLVGNPTDFQFTAGD